ncbi:unnamed protein product [Soboliphyme baturini]|uniref:Translation initiation factor IF-2-like n=1 Tax=Soboliphyme baturini TaxID=241478 RepID=A0A183JB19_9BILA|nr:unnamed protein product [Soboliphyme baturini]
MPLACRPLSRREKESRARLLVLQPEEGSRPSRRRTSQMAPLPSASQKPRTRAPKRAPAATGTVRPMQHTHCTSEGAGVLLTAAPLLCACPSPAVGPTGASMRNTACCIPVSRRGQDGEALLQEHLLGGALGRGASLGGRCAGPAGLRGGGAKPVPRENFRTTPLPGMPHTVPRREKQS